jgi:hypothetical protein
MAGADFSIKGAPIRDLRWQFAEKETSVNVDLGGTVGTIIDEGFLNDRLRLLDSGFRLFVLGESSDGGD